MSAKSKNMEVSGGFPVEKLPIELKLKILERLTAIDLAKLELVSHESKAFIRSCGDLWKKLCYKLEEKLPDCLILKELPPEGLNWNELFVLWTVVLRNKFRFCLFYLDKNVKALNRLFQEALPQRSPVKYYADFGSSSATYVKFFPSKSDIRFCGY